MNGVEIKKQQRIKGLVARKSIKNEERKELNFIITEKIIKLSIYINAETIFSYMPFAGEVDTAFLNEHALKHGKTVCFPVCFDEGVMIAAVPYKDTGMVKGKYGIYEPDKDRYTEIKPRDIDLVIVPCIAFSGTSRMRIGWGAGYYDRYLPECVNAKTIAAAYELQHIEDLCFNDWDVPLDMIVTDRKIYK